MDAIKTLTSVYIFFQCLAKTNQLQHNLTLVNPIALSYQNYSHNIRQLGKNMRKDNLVSWPHMQAKNNNEDINNNLHKYSPNY